jgi:divalent metal cation (Fe/Co/Zn/Cd) transporter
MDSAMNNRIEVRDHLYRLASLLAIVTIAYNLAEGGFSIFFGLEDKTLSLFGFGLDSFVEVISGVGVWHMILRLRQHPSNNPDRFEQQALRVTGTAFYILSLSLIITASANLIMGHHPETTFWGIVVAAVSILTMWLLIRYKVKVGTQLNSDAILSDANCTRACMYLSMVLMAASLGYEFTGIGGIDAIGSIVIAGLSFKEGWEAFAKAAGKACSCTEGCE